MTNFIQKMRLDIGFSDFNCLLDSQCSLLTSQILGRCIKLKWSNRAYAVYWLCGTLLCPCHQNEPEIKDNGQWCGREQGKPPPKQCAANLYLLSFATSLLVFQSVYQDHCHESHHHPRGVRRGAGCGRRNAGDRVHCRGCRHHRHHHHH